MVSVLPNQVLPANVCGYRRREKAYLPVPSTIMVNCLKQRLRERSRAVFAPVPNRLHQNLWQAICSCLTTSTATQGISRLHSIRKNSRSTLATDTADWPIRFGIFWIKGKAMARRRDFSTQAEIIKSITDEAFVANSHSWTSFYNDFFWINEAIK